MSERIKLDVSNNRPTVIYMFSAAYDDFMSTNVARNLRQATIDSYELTKHVFFLFYNTVYNNHAQDINLTAIKDRMMLDFSKYLFEQRGNSAESVNTRLRKLKTMFKFFESKGYMKHVNIVMSKTDKIIKEPFSDEEISALLTEPKLNTGNFTEYRNYVIVAFILETGARLGSVIRIKIKDLSLSKREILISHQKNRIQQKMELTDVMVNLFKSYLEKRKGEPDDYLFCNHSGKFLTEQALKEGFARYCRHRGVTTSTSLHRLRHTFALNFYNKTGDVLRLKNLLNHQSFEMVNRYVNAARLTNTRDILEKTSLLSVAQKKRK